MLNNTDHNRKLSKFDHSFTQENLPESSTQVTNGINITIINELLNSQTNGSQSPKETGQLPAAFCSINTDVANTKELIKKKITTNPTRYFFSCRKKC